MTNIVIDLGEGHNVGIGDSIFTNGICVYKDTPADTEKLNAIKAFLDSTGTAYTEEEYNSENPRHAGNPNVAQNVVTGIMDSSGVRVTQSAIPSTGNAIIDSLAEPSEPSEPINDLANLSI